MLQLVVLCISLVGSMEVRYNLIKVFFTSAGRRRGGTLKGKAKSPAGRPKGAK